MVFTLRPSAHRCRLFKPPSDGKISRSSGIVRFVYGGVVKTFRCATYRMRFAIYFERDPFEDHITRDQWYAAVDAVDGVRLVAANSAEPDTWLGYFVNPRGTPGHQFHDRPDRAHDAEVYFHNTQDWRRAFYWHNAMGDFAGGVINFDSRETDGDSWRTDPVHLASLALADVLNAKLIGEDDTKYEA